MKSETKIKKIKIGTLGNIELNLPIIEIGKGKPSFGIVTGIHGNEPEGLFVVKEVLKQLKDFKGSLKVLPGANPLGLILNQRVGAFDFMDLNRVFPGKGDGTLTEVIARAIFDEFKSCDVVMDIHSVTNVGVFMGMEFGVGSSQLVKKIQGINKLLAPKAIWFSKEGNKYESALCESLIKVGICGVGIEIPKMGLLDEKQLKSIATGIIAVICQKEAKKLKNPIPILADAKRYFANEGGIYTPVMPVLSKVDVGDVIGVVTNLSTFKETKLKSKFKGVLFVQSERKLLKCGDKIYVVCQKIGDFI